MKNTRTAICLNLFCALFIFISSCKKNDFSSKGINTYLIGLLGTPTPIVGGIVAFTAVIVRGTLDIAMDYHTPDLTFFTSDWIKETIYHELSHASHYTKAGNTWYTNFVNAELAEIASHSSPNDPLNPYGPSTSSHAPLIALGEAWGYHMEHFLADKRYGIGHCSDVFGQSIRYKDNSPVAGLSSHLNLIEDFSPTRPNDPFRWIPQGLMYDLIDTRNESTPVLDGVSGFTTAQIFSPLQSDITTLQQYRSRFQQQNPGNQTTQITNLFAQYGY